MLLDITQHEHPALRTAGRKVATIDDKIHTLARDMIETMRQADGIGLASQQVGLPLQMCVLDVPQMESRPSTMRIGRKVVNFSNLMPLVLINPVVETFGEVLLESEGCLSFPGLQGDVPRPFSVRTQATTLDGTLMEFEADGLLARAIQHEFDHLQGVLFIDRMSAQDRLAELPLEIRRLARTPPPSAQDHPRS